MPLSHTSHVSGAPWPHVGTVLGSTQTERRPWGVRRPDRHQCLAAETRGSSLWPLEMRGGPSLRQLFFHVC